MDKETKLNLAEIIENSLSIKSNILNEFNQKYDKKLKLTQLNDLIKDDPYIAEAYKVGKELKQSYVENKALEGMDNGSVPLIIEGLKDNKRKVDDLKHKVALVVYQRSKDFQDFAEQMISIFDGNTQTYRRLESDMLKMNAGLLTITKRQELEIQSASNSLSSKFNSGNLSEEEMVSNAIATCLDVMETGSASLKINASKSLSMLHERAESIKTRKAEAEEVPFDLGQMALKIDELTMGASSAECLRQIRGLAKTQEDLENHFSGYFVRDDQIQELYECRKTGNKEKENRIFKRIELDKDRYLTKIGD